MNPYDVLGVSPASSLAEIETRYRLLLREWHPDVHYASGPDAVARAEAMTRELNAAMSRIRSGEVDPGAGRGYGYPGSSGAAGSAGRTGAGSSPFGTRRGTAYGPPDGGPGRAAQDTSQDRSSGPYGGHGDDGVGAPVPCPFCGVGFLRLADYEAHLGYAHRFRSGGATRARQHAGVLDAIGKVRYVPLWFVTAIGFFLVFAQLWWLLLADLSFLTLVMWAQTSPRFRNRRRWSVLG